MSSPLSSEINAEIAAIDLTSNSSKKFDSLLPMLSTLMGVDASEIHVTSADKPSNANGRLKNGKHTSRHYEVCVLIISADESKITTQVENAKAYIHDEMLGHFNIIVFMTLSEDNGEWCVSHIVTNNASSLNVTKLKTEYPQVIIHETPNVSLSGFPPQKSRNMNPSGGPFQLITYGAPGTGKSYGIEEVVKAYTDTVRTTFHPDSDYATFVGCYKPTMERVKKTYVLEGKEADVKDDGGNPVFEDRIVYSYVPQAFTKAYVRAWRKMIPGADGKVAPQFLVIEEINRGNCAQIFGDLFQLLDRDGAGYSKYAIEADSDLAKHVAKELADISSGIPSEICSGKILKLPPNLYIWATMNTSDQSLFPMDSAFKRRWEWEYIPIKDTGKDWKIVADGVEFKWWDFIKVINKYILDTLKNEDKQLGYFFARPDDDSSDKIVASKFVNKVLFYLYNDVFKDYELPKGFAKQGGGKFSFGDFFLADGKPNEPAVKELLTGLLAQPQ